ncbi:hypothetical protein VYU27_001333 [Nannochloropsis oceanica]
MITTNLDASSGGMSSPAVALAPVEAQRALACLHDLAQKVALLGSMPTSSSLAAKAQILPDSFNDNMHPYARHHQDEDELSKFVRDEFHRHLTEQHCLEARHRDLIRQWHDLMANDYGNNYEKDDNTNPKSPSPLLDTLQTEMTEIGQALAHNSGILLRQLKERPRFSGFGVKMDRERKEFACLLDITIQELRQTGTFVALKTAVEEARQAQDLLAQVVYQEQSTTWRASQLELALQDAIITHQDHVAMQQAAIAALKVEMDRLQYKHEVTLKYTRRKAQAKASGVQHLYRQVEKDLERKQAHLLAQQALERQSFRDLMTYLMEEKLELQGQIAEWTTKADQDFGKLDAENEEVAVARESYSVELESLRTRRKVELAEEVARTMAALAKREEEKAQEALRVKNLEVAALKIGKAVRRYTLQVREQRNNPSAKATDKKEKKGKGKSERGTLPKAGGAEGKKAPAVASNEKPGAKSASSKPATSAREAASKAQVATVAATTAAGGAVAKNNQGF